MRHRLGDCYEPRQIHRSSLHDHFGVGPGNRFCKAVDLRFAVSHRWQYRADMRTVREYPHEFGWRGATRIDQFSGACSQCGSGTRAGRHATMRQRRAILDHQDATPTDRGRVVKPHRQVATNNGGARIDRMKTCGQEARSSAEAALALFTTRTSAMRATVSPGWCVAGIVAKHGIEVVEVAAGGSQYHYAQWRLCRQSSHPRTMSDRHDCAAGARRH
jgi:hypothetical protein